LIGIRSDEDEARPTGQPSGTEALKGGKQCEEQPIVHVLELLSGLGRTIDPTSAAISKEQRHDKIAPFKALSVTS
jgi:hypothetical protein